MGLAVLLKKTIEMYVEYVDVRGYEPERAKYAVINEAIEIAELAANGALMQDVTASGNFVSPQALNRELQQFDARFMQEEEDHLTEMRRERGESIDYE